MRQISIITVCLNSEKTILRCIESIRAQSYHNIQHVIIDGLSGDKTMSIIKSNRLENSVIISEKDSNLYDAMNKGIMHSSGEVIVFLNADDYYHQENIIKNVMSIFKDDTDFVHGKVELIEDDGKVIRTSGGQYDPKEKSIFGMHFPHPAFFVKKKYLNELCPPFDTNFDIASDIKQQLLLIYKLKLNGKFIDSVVVKQAIGGASTKNILSYAKGWFESRKVYNQVFGMGGILFATFKVLRKIKTFEFFYNYGQK